MNLTQASSQWSSRPEDQRFWSLKELYEACEYMRQNSKEYVVENGELSTTHDEKGLCLVTNGKANRSSRMTNWCFSQLCQRYDMPQDFISGLPKPVASLVVNTCITKAKKTTDTNILVYKDFKARCLTSSRYSRIWNNNVASVAMKAAGENWVVPPARPFKTNQFGTRPATAKDILPNQGDFGLSIKVGDPIAPAGLYASDRDCFITLVDVKNRINDGTPAGISRGIMIANSEVWGTKFWVCGFNFRHCCGNHIFWDVSNVKEFGLIHRGNANTEYVGQLAEAFVDYSNASPSNEEGMILAAKNKVIGKDLEEITRVLFREKRIVSQDVCKSAYELAKAESDVYTDIEPGSVWGMVQGITRLSQNEPHMDKRSSIDLSARKVMALCS